MLAVLVSRRFSSAMPVILLVADGARPDALAGDLAGLPALRRLREDGGLHEMTSVFPSVTGPAYTPFLLGRFPGPIGVPGLRWYDRARTAAGWPDHARSYVGYEMGRINRDLDPAAPTIFELVPNSIAALSVVTRGLANNRRIGGVSGWSALRAALTGIDKASHARGHEDALVRDALRIVDDVAARLRHDAERGGYWNDTHLWIVSDHGHSAVHTHDDIAGVVAHEGHRIVAHPWSMGFAPDAAIMVSGNAMAHVYVELKERTRAGWTALAPKWSRLAGALLVRPSVDLVLLPLSANRCEVRNSERGAAVVERAGDQFRYSRTRGDPLAIGADVDGSADDAYDATRHGAYPDAIVQIAALSASARAGDLILSAAPGYDFRDRYEPIPHQSAHGSLHREHMLVPLLTNRRPSREPRRTTDLFASTLAALGVSPPALLDGRSFL